MTSLTLTQIVATLACGLGVLALSWLDRDRDAPRVSRAVWLAAAWVSIGASRTVSQWLGYFPAGIPEWPSTQYLEGNPIERVVLTILVLLAAVVLFLRRERLPKVLKANGPILVFFLYGAVSILWSDYPDVAFKRWVKAIGNLAMVLIVVSDLHPAAAVKALVRRCAFFLIPVSVLFIKYYPTQGRGYLKYTWESYNIGVATDKNGLGAICLIFGLASVWRILEVLRAGHTGRRLGPVIAHTSILMMAFWLFYKANSATAVLCFVLGVALMTVASLRVVARNPTLVHVLLIAVVLFSVFALFTNSGSQLTGAVGRDVTLTGRTVLWQELLQRTVDPWFGAGYDSFWLGERIEGMWKKYYWHPNQAHNGYIEVFLNLGWMGVAILAFIMVWGYGKLMGTFRTDHHSGRLRLTFFVVAIVYNLTEAAFKVMHPVWIAHLLAVAVVPLAARSDK